VGTRCANHVTPLYPQKLALTSPTSGGRSVGMVRSRTKATEFHIAALVRRSHSFVSSLLSSVAACTFTTFVSHQQLRHYIWFHITNYTLLFVFLLLTLGTKKMLSLLILTPFYIAKCNPLLTQCHIFPK